MSFVFFLDIFITYTNWNNYLQKFMYIVRRMHKNDDGDGMRMRSYAVKSVLLCYVMFFYVMLCHVMFHGVVLFVFIWIVIVDGRGAMFGWRHPPVMT